MQVIDAPASAGVSWIRQSFAMFIAQPVGWISLLANWLILSLAVSFVIPVIGAALVTMIQPGLFAGFVIAARDQAAGNPVTLSQLFAGFRFNGRALLMVGSISLLANIMVKVILGLLGFPNLAEAFPADGAFEPQIFIQAYLELLAGKEWMLFLGLALSLLVIAVLWFATPLLALHPMRAGHAIRWSFYAFIANFLPMLLFGITMWGIFFLATLPLLLGWLVALPLYAIAHYTSYQQVFRPD